jgi:predicted enzyme related to lactoylglutathione lyase
VHATHGSTLLRSIDCIRVAVPDLEAGLAFYRDQLGHTLIWRTDTAAGLRLPESEAELVVHVEPRELEVDLLVDSADVAAERWIEAGGSVVVPPFDIPIGRCVVVRDPWGTELVLLDMRNGRLRTDPDGAVIGVGDA